MKKCECSISYGWQDNKCLECGGDVRGVWGLTYILPDDVRKKIKEKKEGISRIASD